MKLRHSALMVLAGFAGVILLLGPAPAAIAQTGYPPGPAGGLGSDQGAVFTQVSSGAVAARPAAVQQSRPLARTGADVLRWTVLALALSGTGALFLVIGRRRLHPRT